MYRGYDEKDLELLAKTGMLTSGNIDEVEKIIREIIQKNKWDGPGSDERLNLMTARIERLRKSLPEEKA